jgi:hypothetical protein
MGNADLGFSEKEWLVIAGAPALFFGGITTLIVPLGLLIWFLVSWAYRHRFAAKNDQLDAKNDQLNARDERLTHAKEKQQDAEQKTKDLQSVIEKLTVQLDAKASIEDIAITASSAKTKAGELVDASNAVSSAIASVATVSTASGMRVQLEAINPAWDKPK